MSTRFVASSVELIPVDPFSLWRFAFMESVPSHGKDLKLRSITLLYTVLIRLGGVDSCAYGTIDSHQDEV